jgi:Tfp pilus assembly protein FimT
VLVAILAVAAVPTFQHMADVRVETVAARLRSDLRAAQHVALSRHRSTWAVFNIGTQTVRLTVEDPANPGPVGRVPYTDPLTRGDHLVTLGTEGVSLTSVNFGGAAEVEFDRRGVPRNAAGAALTATGVVTLNGVVTVQVRPETGWVDVVP